MKSEQAQIAAVSSRLKASSNTARPPGLAGKASTKEAVAPGKLADLVVLERNPLANVNDSDSVRYTMVNGSIGASQVAGIIPGVQGAGPREIDVVKTLVLTASVLDIRLGRSV